MWLGTVRWNPDNDGTQGVREAAGHRPENLSIPGLRCFYVYFFKVVSLAQEINMDVFRIRRDHRITSRTKARNFC